MGLRRHRRQVLGRRHGPRMTDRLSNEYGNDARLMKVEPSPRPRWLEDPLDITRD